MNLLKAVLATALVAAVTCTWNAKGVEETTTSQATKKELTHFAETGFGGMLCFREYDTHDIEGINPGLIEGIYALKKARNPDHIFSTALSDSLIVRQPNGDAWLIRLFYKPEDHSPWQDTVWLGKLSGREIPQTNGRILLTLSNVVPVRIPKALAGFMEPFRSSNAVVSERRSQLMSMLDEIDQSIRNWDGMEEILRQRAEGVRKYGDCCPGDAADGQSNEERASELERRADELRIEREKNIAELNKVRAEILPQLNARAGKTRRGS